MVYETHGTNLQNSPGLTSNKNLLEKFMTCFSLYGLDVVQAHDAEKDYMSVPRIQKMIDVHVHLYLSMGTFSEQKKREFAQLMPRSTTR